MDLRARVQQSLSGTHTIEHELGGGGMSRVFVAKEQRLGRKVVVKVLAPDLAAAISAERFEREIQLAASLQQANILPVLAAGDVEGLPYYTMPYVEGESLRARIAHGPVSIGQAMEILRDVARALAYAHAHGVVHRDIKPDNILLSGHTAVVADFGIAKAIAAAQEQSSGSTLTQLGTAVGTPAYMAPEQAAGDPSTDHRADIYAFGCMAYELLAGHPPFHGLSPHKLMAAHMGETPRPIEELRPDCPPTLARLVARCLAKEPARRPASAEELLRELDVTTSGPGIAMPLHGRGLLLRAMAFYAAAFIAVAIVARLLVDTQGLPEWVFGGALIVMALGFPVILFTGYTQYVARKVAQATPTLTPHGTLVRPSGSGTLQQLAVKASPHVSWTRTARGGIAALTVFALLVAGYLVLRVLGIGPSGSLMAAGKINAQDRVLVATFDAASRDSALGDVVSEAVRTNLSQSRAVNVVSTNTVVGALQRMERPATTRVDLALAREVAQREGIKAVVAGSVATAGEGFIITARLVNAQSGDELAVFRESAANAGEIIPTVDRLTRQLRGRIGESLKTVADAPALSQVTTSSLDALRAFAAGLRANDVEGDFAKAVPLFEEAIAKDSGFAAAYVQLAYSLGNARVQAARRDSLFDRAYLLRSRLPETERYTVEGAYLQRRGDRRAAMTAYEHAVAIDSFNTDAINSLALLDLLTRRYPSGDQLFRRALVLEPDNGVFMSNLVGTLLSEGRLDAADSLLQTMRAQKVPFPTARRTAHLLYLREQYDSAEKMLRGIVRAGNVTGAIDAMDFLRNLTALRGRLRESDSIATELRARNAERGEPPPPLGDAMWTAFADALLRDRPHQAVALLDSAMRTVPVGSAMPPDRLLELTRIYAIAGAPDRARTVLKQADVALRDSTTRRQLDGQRTEAEGEIALAERRTAEAIRLFKQSDVEADGLPQTCRHCLPMLLGRAYDQADQADSAIANFERYLDIPNPFRVQLDQWMMAPAHKRLGELYEARGDAKRAAAHYAAFVELWKRADPDLQPKVAQVRMRLAALRRTLPQ